MKFEVSDLIIDLSESINHIEKFLHNLSIEKYENNLLVRRAVEREFEIIGEILKRLSLDFPQIYSKIPDARKIIDFRNIIAHGYDVIDNKRIFLIAKTNLPLFKKAINNIRINL